MAMACVDAALETDAALVVPTSGSTGAPKGVMLEAAALLHSANATLARLGGPGLWLLALPVTHIAGLQVLVRSIVARIEPECLELSGGFGCEAFIEATARLARRRDEPSQPAGPGRRRAYTALVPAQLEILLSSGKRAWDALSAFDAVLVGGAAAPRSLVERAHGAAPGTGFVTTYGMSETSGGCIYDGRPLDGVKIDFDDGGRAEGRARAAARVALGGPTLFSGYRLRPELTSASLRLRNGSRWFVTNDAGSMGPDGRLSVLGRIDDMIVTGGEKVAPEAVEEALLQVPWISEAGVTGLPDERWGEVVAAAIVPIGPRPGTGVDRGLDRELLTVLRHDLRGVLGGPSLPRRLVVVDALPRLGIGKIDRGALRGLFVDID